MYESQDEAIGYGWLGFTSDFTGKPYSLDSILAKEILCTKPNRRLFEISKSLSCMRPKRRPTQRGSSFVQIPRGGYGEPSVILSCNDINKHEQVYMTKCVCAFIGVYEGNI